MIVRSFIRSSREDHTAPITHDAQDDTFLKCEEQATTQNEAGGSPSIRTHDFKLPTRRAETKFLSNGDEQTHQHHRIV